MASTEGQALVDLFEEETLKLDISTPENKRPAKAALLSYIERLEGRHLSKNGSD
jgi:hypothetical protein